MKLRTKIGILLIAYGIIGFLIEFFSAVTSIYQSAVSASSANDVLSSALNLFFPFGSSMLETVLWFSMAILLGSIFVLYKKLLTKQKPPWITGPISQQKA